MKKYKKNYIKKYRKTGEWLLVDGENFMHIQPEFCCSECHDMISTYYPPERCRKCNSINQYKNNKISVRIE